MRPLHLDFVAQLQAQPVDVLQDAAEHGAQLDLDVEQLVDLDELVVGVADHSAGVHDDGRLAQRVHVAVEGLDQRIDHRPVAGHGGLDALQHVAAQSARFFSERRTRQRRSTSRGRLT